MQFDFNQAEAQKERVSGPVPAGSIVLMRLEIQKPTRDEYAAKPGSYVSKSKGGLLMLNCQMTVAAGTYEGYHWFERFMLPEGMQSISLTSGQKDACRISYARLRAIIEAHKRIDPKDQSQRARAARTLSNLLDLNGMTFPCRLGLEKEPRFYAKKDGSQGVAWDNRVSYILPATDARFTEIMNGGEIITDGPTAGEMPTEPYNNSSTPPNDSASIPGWDTPPIGVDDVPF